MRQAVSRKKPLEAFQAFRVTGRNAGLPEQGQKRGGERGMGTYQQPKILDS